jgi:hypothetical protein
MLIKWLPPSAINLLAIIFNVVFFAATFPPQWCSSRLNVIFKSGNRLECGNYRGIALTETLAKLYDSVLERRLGLWNAPDAVQAGAQKNRSCLEQILALRMLIDFCKAKKKKLYVLFVDFSKAYDKVPRDKLIECLKQRGCGRIMLQAIQAAYSNTSMVFKDTTISTYMGVRQGAPTSCRLFITYIDDFVKKLKARVNPDSFLGTLHTMLLMDDMIIMASDRERCLQKLEVLLEFCQESEMKLNAKKTLFMTINGETQDKEPLRCGATEIANTREYTYLGAYFEESGKPNYVIAAHTAKASKHVDKLTCFCHYHSMMPFKLKEQVFQAALLSAILYSSESWLTNNLQNLEVQYHRALKALLGVRTQTINLLCRLELAKPPVQALISERRVKFLRKFMTAETDAERPLSQVWALCEENQTPGYRFLRREMERNENAVAVALTMQEEQCRERALSSSKIHSYLDHNPRLEKHSVYASDVFIPDHERRCWTQFRLSAHRLRIETGRWSRTPRDQRLCACGTGVQDEQHVIFTCPLTMGLRADIDPDTVVSLDAFFRLIPELTQCHTVTKILNLLNQ